MIAMSVRLMERFDNVLDHEAIENIPGHDPTLTEIMHMVDMPSGTTSTGWNAETARLFALDTAMTSIRRHLALISESDKHILVNRLHEARSLVVTGRDTELGFIQAYLETHLAMALPEQERRVWLTAIDALIPCPFRSALVSTRNALSIKAMGGFTDVARLLRNRLLARLGEGSLLSDTSSDLDRTA